ncbi:hypothetical protein [Pseudomonas phage PhL_UNISO_PA-DSM_ph0034]|uniref:Uncharacterized protein n=2 Tax=Pakpunavirus TaxID=1921407 RepID=A0A9E6QCE9_9CAUD|nr:hypothetical protein QE329_gp012 [Pseudomonas phage PhL_UNISO_PA-DSM_ph0034]YP_010763504.1 hypothetical protein QE330_gp046 [Pseudomonas phage vB_Pae_Kat]QYC95132.1 hypothetical protein [Pseudomonas phage PhL_UNISO_PA-DSM_ph0034]UQS93560.1 hypothetical protein Kat_gp152 [Pseudomonas phage vB_Pae_Kat]WNV48918.1 hypothetical protein [Pseudomonas phage Kat]
MSKSKSEEIAVEANGLESYFISHYNGWDLMDTACLGFYIKPEYVLDPDIRELEPSFLELDFERCRFRFWGNEDEGVDGKLMEGKLQIMTNSFEYVFFKEV